MPMSNYSSLQPGMLLFQKKKSNAYNSLSSFEFKTITDRHVPHISSKRVKLVRAKAEELAIVLSVGNYTCDNNLSADMAPRNIQLAIVMTSRGRSFIESTFVVLREFEIITL